MLHGDYIISSMANIYFNIIDDYNKQLILIFQLFLTDLSVYKILLYILWAFHECAYVLQTLCCFIEFQVVVPCLDIVSARWH